jgi:hypothetical protein
MVEAGASADRRPAQDEPSRAATGVVRTFVSVNIRTAVTLKCKIAIKDCWPHGELMLML